MLYIAEKLRALRRERELTQEELSDMLGVSSQSVSKWERGDTYPDITMLPALASLFQTSVDNLLGMEKIVSDDARNAVFEQGAEQMRAGEYAEAAKVYTEAFKTFPNDAGLMSNLAFALALSGGENELRQSIDLCERVLAGNPGEKVRHTTRAALCFIYMKAGETERAWDAASELPHMRESREAVQQQLIAYIPPQNPVDPTPRTKLGPPQLSDEIDRQLRFIAVGEKTQQDVVSVELGINAVAAVEAYELIDRIIELRREVGGKKLPLVRIRDNNDLTPNRVTVRWYADCLLDEEFEDPEAAAAAIVDVLRRRSDAEA